MCTITDTPAPTEPITLTLTTTLSRLLEFRTQQSEQFNVLDELAVKIHEAHDHCNEALLSELLTKACDVEYELLGDCEVFGDLAQQWRVDDTEGNPMYVDPEPDTNVVRWNWILANAPAPPGFEWRHRIADDNITLWSHDIAPTIYEIPAYGQPLRLLEADAHDVALRDCLARAAACPAA